MTTTQDTGAPTTLLRERIKAALWNHFIADALAMPVHWFYNPGDIIRAFPPSGIERLEAAPEYHPSSIMALHSTARGGRAKTAAKLVKWRRRDEAAKEEIVGDVILKGRRHLWGRPNGHYHHGLEAGSNTLNAWWALELLQWISEHREYDPAKWVEHYIGFMTADPPAYPDVYAESCHRGFFANWTAGQKPTQCGAVTHDTPSMGALVTVAPLALALFATKPLAAAQEQCREHVWLTHPDADLMRVVDAYVELLYSLLHAPKPATNEYADKELYVRAASAIPGTRLEKLLAQDKGDAFVVGRTYSLACYITDSWPSVCYLAARYASQPTLALLRNANLGGENAHRGSVLGTLTGLDSASHDNELAGQLV
ncbi:MAG: ADP-ribosylglycohydrolase family protein, partial [Granulosicoccus sp.]